MSQQPELISLDGERQKRWRKLRRWLRQRRQKRQKARKSACPCQRSKRVQIVGVSIPTLNAAYGAAAWALGWSLEMAVVLSVTAALALLGVFGYMRNGHGVETQPHLPSCPHQKNAELSARR